MRLSRRSQSAIHDEKADDGHNVVQSLGNSSKLGPAPSVYVEVWIDCNQCPYQFKGCTNEGDTHAQEQKAQCRSDRSRAATRSHQKQEAHCCEGHRTPQQRERGHNEDDAAASRHPLSKGNEQTERMKQTSRKVKANCDDGRKLPSSTRFNCDSPAKTKNRAYLNHPTDVP